MYYNNLEELVGGKIPKNIIFIFSMIISASLSQNLVGTHNLCAALISLVKMKISQ